MENFQSWLREHKFEVHLLAFIMMVLPPVAMYFAALAGSEALIWGLVSLVALANLLVVFVR